MRRLLWVLLLVSLVLVMSPVAGALPPEYGMVDLGITEPGSDVSATASGMNNRGQIVGALIPWGPLAGEGFMWDGGDVTMLGSPPDDPRTSVLPSAINNRGQIVGGLALPGFLDFTGFLYENGDWTEILATDATFSGVVDINDRGQVVGYDEGPSRAFIWEKGTFTYLDFAAQVIPHAINNRGQVVGVFREDWQSPSRSFIWDRGAVTAIGDATGEYWVADVNDRGEAVGSHVEPGPGIPMHQAFLWTDGAVIDLPELIENGYGTARAINNRGQVVGSWTEPGGQYHAVLWEHDTVIDLGTWGDGCAAWDINEPGQIVGECWDDGVSHAYLWER